jgi:fructose-1,6-bisphosphatase/inositol monophosphatase family enzyme
VRPDPDRTGAIIAEVAESEMLPHYRNLAAESVKTKDSPTDLVTIVDETVERTLRKRLLELTPGAAFIGEEGAAADPKIAGAIRTASSCWIVDPLDGTRNFVNGVDEFGTIVAFVENGVTTGGWIYAAPLRATAIAVRGEGVTWRGAPPVISPQREETPSGLRSVGWLKPEWRDRIVASLKSNLSSRPGHCSAYAYLKLMAGEVDFKLSSRIHAWDHAAGALMLEELGGRACWLDTKQNYAPQESEDRPLLATAPGRDWAEIASRLLN